MAVEKNEALVIVHDELEQLRQRIIANHRAAGQVASGRTIQSLRVEKTDEGGVLYGRKAFGTLETGRKGGKVPRGFYKIILQWMEDKGIQVEKPKSFAFLVSRKIAKEGTLLYRMGGRNDIYSPEVKKAMEAVEIRIGALFGEEVEHINLNFNENNNI